MKRRMVAAVVPTFRPGADVLARLDVISAQVDVVIVSDDGSGPGFASELDRIEHAGHRVLRSSQNRGIARALNVGIAAATGLAADYVLTLDQDSGIGQQYVEAAVDALAESGDPEGFRTVVVAGRFDGVRPITTSVRWPGEKWELLQSGAFVSTALLGRVGGFDETLFIDCVDTEWGLRARGLGVRFAISDGCVLQHEAGVENEVRLPLIGAIRFSVHSPIRRFYIARNRVALSKRYALANPTWFVWQTRTQLTIAVLGLVAGPARAAQLEGTLAGAISAIAGRRGRITGRLAARLAR